MSGVPVTLKIQNVKNGDTPCKNPIVEVVCQQGNLAFPCSRKVKPNGELEIVIPTEAFEQGDSCVTLAVKCEECDRCPAKEVEVCFCDSDTDCKDCQLCIDGICIDQCPEEFCINGVCAECASDEDCPEGFVCLNGRCVCQSGLIDDRGHCVDCLGDEDCGLCEVCIGGDCVPKDCGDQKCDPDTGDCVDCLTSEDCGPNQICIDGECVCKEGFRPDPVTGECVADCFKDSDCGPCEICVGGQCQSRCEEGEKCIDDKCVPWPCNDVACDDGADCGVGCGCVNGECVPCALLGCASPTEFGGCEAANVLGCECNAAGDCVGVTDPCANYACSQDCGNRPDCECVGGKCVSKNCKSDFKLNKEGCSLKATLSSNECCPCGPHTINNRIDNATRLSSQIDVIEGTLFIRKGIQAKVTKEPTGASGLILDSIPLVDDSVAYSVAGNEEPISGKIGIYITYELETPTGSIIEDDTYGPESDNPLVQLDVLSSSEVLWTLNNTVGYVPVGSVINGNTVKSANVTFRVYETIVFLSGCKYEPQYLFRYKVDSPAYFDVATTPISEDVFFHRSTLLVTDNCANPTFFWFRGHESVDGVQFDQLPFRVTYVSKDSTSDFVDIIDSTEINQLHNVNNNIDDHSELWSGHYYKVTTNCGCGSKTVNLESCGSEPGIAVFCDPTEAKVDWQCGSVTFAKDFVTGCPINFNLGNDLDSQNTPFPYASGDPDSSNQSDIHEDAQVYWAIYANGIDIIPDSIQRAKSGSNVDSNGNPIQVIYKENDEYEFDNLSSIVIKWGRCLEKDSNGNCITFQPYKCDECNITLVSNVPPISTPGYDIECIDDGGARSWLVTFKSLQNYPDLASIVFNGVEKPIGNSTEAAFSVGVPQSYDVTFKFNEKCQATEEVVVTANCDCPDVFITSGVDCDNDTTSINLVLSNSLNYSGTYTFTNSSGEVVEVEGDTVSYLDTYVSGYTYTVRFTNAFCDKSNSSTPFLRGSSVIESLQDSEINVCGNNAGDIVYNTPNLTGDVVYSVDGGADLFESVSSGSVNITIPTGAQTVVIKGNSLANAEGDQCVTLTPSTFNINYLDELVSGALTVSDNDICEGESVTLTITGASPSTSAIIDEIAQTIEINGSGVGTLVLTPVEGVQTYTYSALQGGECDDLVVGQSVSVTVNAGIVVESITTNCSADLSTYTVTVDLGSNADSVTVNGNAVTPGFGSIYNWDVPSGNVATIIITTGTCVITEEISEDCECGDVPQPTVSQTSVDYCSGANPAVNVTSPSGSLYNIVTTNGTVTPPIDPDTYVGGVSITGGSSTTLDADGFPGWYAAWLVADDGSDCTSEPVYVEFTEITPPTVNILGPSTVCNNETGSVSAVVSNGSGTYSYEWSTNQGSVTGSSSSVNFDPQSTIGTMTITVIITDLITDCTNTANINITLEDCTTPCDEVTLELGDVSQDCLNYTVEWPILGGIAPYTIGSVTGGVINGNNGTNITYPACTAGNCISIVGGDVLTIDFAEAELGEVFDGGRVTIVDDNGCERTFVVNFGGCSIPDCDVTLSGSGPSGLIFTSTEYNGEDILINTFNNSQELVNSERFVIKVTNDGTTTTLVDTGYTYQIYNAGECQEDNGYPIVDLSATPVGTIINGLLPTVAAGVDVEFESTVNTELLITYTTAPGDVITIERNDPGCSGLTGGFVLKVTCP
jgi:Cys-rich repeat protein